MREMGREGMKVVSRDVRMPLWLKLFLQQTSRASAGELRASSPIMAVTASAATPCPARRLPHHLSDPVVAKSLTLFHPHQPLLKLILLLASLVVSSLFTSHLFSISYLLITFPASCSPCLSLSLVFPEVLPLAFFPVQFSQPLVCSSVPLTSATSKC